MASQTMKCIRIGTLGIMLSAAIMSNAWGKEESNPAQKSLLLEKIRLKRNDEKALAEMLPIVRCSFKPSAYEEILIAQLRNTQSSTKQFRLVSEKIGDLLVSKVIECLPTKNVEIETPVTKCQGKALAGKVELVSIMRSGDALLDTFMGHFPEANISKFLIQRDEKTTKPQFKYMKVSPDIASGNQVVITEPMIATGGTLEMVITLLKDRGVHEENIIIASVCVAPEGLILLNERFPKVKVVMTTMDEKLNERKFIVPGLGDFGDRFFGTSEKHLVLNVNRDSEIAVE
jgi:uracil phosphoribosyltransferase